MKTILTTRRDPDMDGVACVLAYEKFFHKQGDKSKKAVFGGIQDAESYFVLQRLGLNFPSRLNDEANEIYLLDFGEMRGLPGFVRADRVTKVIDHRPFVKYDQFPSAQFQVEIVGSATTLIAEKFQFGRVELDSQFASLLCCGTISNTLNLKAKVTTIRDYRSCEWLIAQGADIGLANEMIRAKSDYIVNHLEESMVLDSRIDRLTNEKTLNCIQLEIFDGQELTKHSSLQAIVDKLKLQTNIVLLLIQDLSKGQTLLYGDAEVISILDFEGFGNIVKSENMIYFESLYLRKQLLPQMCILLGNNL